MQKQPPEMFCKKAVFRNFAIFTEKPQCLSLFLIKLPSFRAKFLRTHILKNINTRLLQEIVSCNSQIVLYFYPTSSLAHLFAIRGRRKRGPGTLQTRDQNLPK